MSKGKSVKKKRKNTSTGFSKIGSFFRDERVRIILGLVIIVFTVYLLLAFVSYLVTWKEDQSKLDIPLGEFIVNADITVDNWAGKYGALLANKLIHHGLGLASFAGLFLGIIIGFRFLKLRLLSLRKSIKFTIIITVWLSIALSLLFGDSWFLLGGAHGFFVCTWLNAVIGKVGTAFLLLIVLFVFVILTFDGILDWLRNKLSKIFNRNDEDDKDPEFEDSTKSEEPVNNDTTIDTPELEIDLSDNEDPDKSDSVELDPTLDISDKPDVDNEELIIEGLSDKITDSEDGIELIIEDKTDEEDDQVKEINQQPEGDYDPTLDLSHYKFPPIDLLDDHKSESQKLSQEEWEKELKENKNRIVETLGHYKIEISRISAKIGPTVTLYEIVPAPGVRISKIKNLEDDIALSLSALGIRIIAPMPGKGTIGIEVPNPKPDIVSMKSVIASKVFQETKFDLPLALGKTISNDTYVVDLTKMPHMLVAGATGQGKSVGINAILTSLLYKKHPSQIKFVLIDPKKVELSIYSRIEKHFLAKLPDTEDAIITDTQKVVATMNSLCKEMDIRYDLLKKAECRNLKEYNSKFVTRKLNPDNGHKFLPYIVVVIDEFADLIMTAGKEVETPIARIAQLARAIGIHLIIATQRPSTNIITGVIKANFPSRVAFKVSSMIDSRTILDTPGANQLIGRGDMLITRGSELVRVQCAFVDTPEVDKITMHIEKQQSYPTAHFLPEIDEEGEIGGLEIDLKKRDALFDDAARLLVSHQQGSTSLIQRKFSIGYNRAGKIIDQLEAAGIVGQFQGSKARSVLFQDEYSLEQFLKTLD